MVDLTQSCSRATILGKLVPPPLAVGDRGREGEGGIVP